MPPSDFDIIRNMGGPNTEATPMGAAETIAALNRMRETQAGMQAQQKDQAPPPLPQGIGGIRSNADGTYSFDKVDPRLFEGLMQSKQKLDEIMGAFHQEATRLQAQEQQVRSQPWMQLATALSANLAQARDMPGFVQALGRTAGQLNPTADQLRTQRLAVLGQEATMAERSVALDEASLRTQLEYARERRLTESAAAAQAARAFGELADLTQRGELTDASVASKVLQNAGYSKAAADTQADLLVKASQEKQRLVAAAQAATDKRTADTLRERARESDARMAVMLKAIQVKTSEKTDADKALEATAQSLAKGDLSAIRDVSSFRGSDRMKLYARAKEINPNFSTSELTRKINMEQSFTVGKDSVGIQSFDTFLQHAGEVTETLKGIELKDSRLLNRSINWWRRNMKGTPELARLETSLEPVAKEFESFLLNQRALYSDDRRQMAMLLNPDQPLNVTMATLNQMGKTAKDRFSAMNQRYKRLMGQDLENPFSNEALLGAAKIGITLPSGSSSETEFPWEKK